MACHLELTYDRPCVRTEASLKIILFTIEESNTGPQETIASHLYCASHTSCKLVFDPRWPKWLRTVPSLRSHIPAPLMSSYPFKVLNSHTGFILPPDNIYFFIVLLGTALSP